MKLTPLDIKKQEFKKVMRGYDTIEVDTFMDMMASEFEEVLKQQKDLRDRILELETQLKDYKQIERTLQQTLLQAQEATSKTYESARKESELITREAELRATQLLGQANTDLRNLNHEISQLKAKKDSLIGRLRVLLSSELDLIKTIEMGGGAMESNNGSQGTGKESIQLDEILKTINNDRAS